MYCIRMEGIIEYLKDIVQYMHLWLLFCGTFITIVPLSYPLLLYLI